MSESDFYTVNHRYEAQGAPQEWPTWELKAHGSAAPAPGSAVPDEATGPDGRECPLPRLDPLGSWCSARLSFADGARIDVLVAVSDDHITVEDVRADPPLRLDGLADLARWIEGPLDDAFRAATGRPQKHRPAPCRPGPAATAPEQGAGPTTGTAYASGAMGGTAPESTTGPTPEPMVGAAPEPMAGPTPDPVAGGAYEQVAGAGYEPVAGAAGESPAGAVEEAAVHRADPASTDGATDGAVDVVGVEGAEGAEGTEGAVTGAAGADAAPGKSGAAAREGAEEHTRSALLARSRASERRRLAAEAYRQAQREGRDPVLAVMLATGRNRRRSLRLIAGARDEGLLTPRHNKR
ncbi:DUF6214 family protein [Streptomyces sp. NPDC048506]|uniref:DUF6214 family protein n=1 Tax=Streptomyces sp. NPDC048506 TaxID=3155028 RepID=UPI00342A8C6A